MERGGEVCRGEEFEKTDFGRGGVEGDGGVGELGVGWV